MREWEVERERKRETVSKYRKFPEAWLLLLYDLSAIIIINGINFPVRLFGISLTQIGGPQTSNYYVFTNLRSSYTWCFFAIIHWYFYKEKHSKVVLRFLLTNLAYLKWLYHKNSINCLMRSFCCRIKMITLSA